MQKYFSILILLLFFSKTNAQQELEPGKVKADFEIGLQANALFGRLLNDDASGLIQNPYLLTGKLVFGHYAIRLGVGGQHDKEIQREKGFANSITSLKQRLDLRLGVERRFSLGGQWQGNLAFDAIADWTQDKVINDSGFDVITTTKDLQYIGGGLSVGIKYQLTNRLSVGTEGFLYYTVGELTDGEFFKNFPVGEDDINKSEVYNLKVGLPSALYLILELY